MFSDGASFAGSLGVTSSAGPGIALKAEGISLAVASELPLVVVNTQRGGPSTGLPTKTEQSDFNMALFGRHGDTPIPVVAASTATDCFDVAIEAVRLAIRYMTPVMILSDGYLANASEPWKIPNFDSLKSFRVNHYDDPKISNLRSEIKTPKQGFGQSLARQEWSIELVVSRRVSKLVIFLMTQLTIKKMTELRKEKVAQIAHDIPSGG